MMTPRSFPETGFSVTVRNVLTPSLPVKRQPAGTLIVASDPSAPFAGPLAQGILSACAAAAAGRKARHTARREMIERAIMQPPANRVRRESGGALFGGNNIVKALKNATRRALNDTTERRCVRRLVIRALKRTDKQGARCVQLFGSSLMMNRQIRHPP